jgi:hypothetical protein
LLTLASGETGHVTVTATVSDAASPGAFSEFEIISFEGTTGLNEFDLLTVPIDEPTGCHVDTLHELMIKSTSVVDDVLRTGPPGADPRMGVWTFQHLAETMAATPADAPAMVEGVLDSMAGDETINGFQVAGRPGMKDVIKNWPRTADGKLDLSRAPMMLQAIVNRFDLRNLANGDAGEGRFVFAFMQPDLQNPFQATMIFEYKLPAATDADVRGWAAAFHQLGSLPFGEDYNAALQAITERFAGRGARPGHPNGSAINTVRTNEIAFGGIWEMRQFQLSATTGRLEPHVVDLTPDLHFNDSSTVADYIDQNQAAIIAETHAVPDSFEGQPFAAGTVFNDLSSWFAPGVDPEARFHFSVNTCNGCHSLQETQTGFLQISPRVAHSEATLSAFLQGTTVSDPVTGQPRTLNDLGRRNTDLKAIVCDDPTAKALAGTTLRKGIQRVH